MKLTADVNEASAGPPPSGETMADGPGLISASSGGGRRGTNRAHGSVSAALGRGRSRFARELVRTEGAHLVLVGTMMADVLGVTAHLGIGVHCPRLRLRGFRARCLVGLAGRRLRGLGGIGGQRRCGNDGNCE